MTKKQFSILGGITILSLILSLIITPLRGGYFKVGSISGFQLSSIVGFIIYYAVTAWLLYRTHNKYSQLAVVGSILLGMSIVGLSIRIIYYSSTQISFLEYFIHLLAVPAGYLYYKAKNTRLKVFITISFSIISLWLSIFGYQMWLHKLNFGTFLGEIENGNMQELSFQKSNGDTISLNDYKGKYLVLDCWTTSCGVCYKKFPIFQELYNKYKDNQKIILFALHCRVQDYTLNKKESYSTGNEILNKKKYEFPCISIDAESIKLKELGVKGYPTVLIFNKSSQLIYRGNVEGATKMVEELVSNKHD